MKKTYFVLFLWLLRGGIAVGDSDPGALFVKGVGDYASGKAADAAKSFKALHDSNPKDDIALYLLSAAYARAGNDKESLQSLKELAGSGSCLIPREESFGALAKTAEYQAIVKTLAQAGTHPESAKTAITLDERDFFPEGIAYDQATNALYMGSIYKRKIEKIDIKSGKAETFVASQQDGLMAVLGLKVDPARHVLWAASVADPTMKGYSEKENGGMNALHKYDLRTGKLIGKYTLTEGKHYLNDLVIDASGRVYVTDSETPQILTIAADGTQLEPYVPEGTFASLNGIAIADDQSALFASDTIMGIYRISLKDKTIARLRVKAGIETLGNDGLYFYKNSLIGVFNMMSPGRIMRYYLDASQLNVVRSEVMECGKPALDEPTTAAIVGDELYVVANSQLRKHNPDNTPFSLDKLDPPRIHSLKLH